MDRLMIVSADCHWGDSVRQYRSYLEQEYLEDFDVLVGEIESQAGVFESFAAAMAETSAETKEALGLDDMEQRAAFAHGTNNEVRLKELAADGVVGEVIFPNLVVPFASSFTMARTGHPVEHQMAGQRAYNRALVDFLDPRRQAGLALISYFDIGKAVREVHWAKDAGMKGVLVGSTEAGLPTLGVDEYYEPLWAACAETGLPIHFHGSAGPPDVDASKGTAAARIWATEAIFYAHRALWHLIWGGVPQRHPDLKIVFTEVMSDWQVRALRSMDWLLDHSFIGHGTAGETKPSELWERQFYCGSSILSSAEVALRGDLGVEKMMFGSDFPHPEGTWGKTAAYLQAAFGGAGVSESDTRAICGLNAARLYELDLPLLTELAAEHGPEMEFILSTPTGKTDPHVDNWLTRPISPN